MARDIRFAGLDEWLRQQVRHTAQLIQNSRDRVTAQPWDNAACDVLVADGRNRQGLYAIGQAEQLGVPVLVVSDHPNNERHPSVQGVTTAASLTRAVHAVLLRNTRVASG